MPFDSDEGPAAQTVPSSGGSKQGLNDWNKEA
jgi:hypothetical protein